MNELRVLPGYSRYRIGVDGSVQNVLEGTWLTGSTNPDGYVNFRLTDDSGNAVTIGRHRLIALLFLDSPDYPNAVVNHRNGVKGDDRIDNLEWTTHQGNIEHAGEMGLTEKCLPVSTRDPITEAITHYPSAISAARTLGLTKDAVLWRIRNGEERIYPEGLQYRLRDDTRPWATAQTSVFGRAQATLVRDIRTGEVRRFARQTDVAEFLGCSLSTVNVVANTIDQQLQSGHYLVKLESDERPWREVTDPLTENKRVRAVVAIEDATGLETIYSSAKECADARGLLATTLNERLKSNGTKPFKDGFRYRYYQP